MKSDARKFVFVHIPKCGGTSVEEVLFPKHERTLENFWMGFEGLSALPGLRRLPRRIMRPTQKMNRYQTDALQHLTALQMRHAMGRDTFESYYRFGIVRHPTKRILSQYKYMRKRGDLRGWIGMKRSDSFMDYLKKTYRRHHVQWQEQISFLYDYRGQCLVHDIVKLEEIDIGMKVVFENIGMDPIPIPHMNKTKDTPSRRVTITENEKDVIWELFKDDFEMLGYDINA